MITGTSRDPEKPSMNISPFRKYSRFCTGATIQAGFGSEDNFFFLIIEKNIYLLYTLFMPKIIDHQKRKEEILKRAFALFSRQGYQNTNLSNLADICRISRPTLYLYFKDKDDIFRFAIKQFTDTMIVDYKKIAKNKNQTILEQLKQICDDIIVKCYHNIDFILSLADFIIQMRHQGIDVTDAIKRRTVRLKYLFSQLVAEGIRKGEIEPYPAQDIVIQLMALLQAYIYQIAILGITDETEALNCINFFFQKIKK